VRNLIESFIDVGSGFVLALLIQIYIFPFFGLYPTIMVGIKIALIFTVISILRSWFWRTVFKRI
jgi:protein-S-isoprenylcysteine O-methyltransferase Ste14